MKTQMHDTEVNQLIKKALFLETNQRTEFLNQLEEGELKQKITFLLNDDVELTQFILKTSHGAKALALQHIKDLKPGDKINQFIIVKLIAKGGMGSVYLAYDEKLKRNVAIKTIRSEYLKNHATQQRFKQEAQILSQINHPSICQIYDYIDYEDGDLLVLELVDGITLSNIDLSDSEKLDTFIQIASALVAAHNKDVIHRDLKPDNIMRTDERKIKVLDFGIAKSKVADEALDKGIIDNDNQQLTKMGTLMGTLLYMSPEQAEGKEITKASDIYSLGIIMQEMLTGVTVYDLANTKDLKEQVIKAEKINSDLIPKKYRKLIDQITQRDPKNRPNAKTLKQALEVIKQVPSLQKSKFKKLFVVSTTLGLIAILLYQWFNFSNERKSLLIKNKFDNQIEEISFTWNKIYMLPIHNISKNLSRIKIKKEKLIKAIEGENLLSISDKKLFTGNVLFAYRSYEKALPLLENVWNSGVRGKVLAEKLVHLHLLSYFNKSRLFLYKEGYKDKEYYLKLHNVHVEKAKQYIQSSGIDFGINSIPKAMLAWIDNDIDTALKILTGIISEEDWQFEAYQIKGEILRSLGKQSYENGKFEIARVYYGKAIETFKKSALRGRSYLKAYRQICIINSIIDRIEIDIIRNNKFNKDDFLESIGSCESALVIAPKDQQIFEIIIDINNLYAQQLYKMGKNPTPYLQKAIKLTNNLNETNRKYFLQATSYNSIASYKSEIGENPIGDFDKAIEASFKAISFQNKGLDVNYSNIMSIYLMKTYYENSKGINPENSLKNILKLYNLSKESKNSSNDVAMRRNSILAYAYGYQASYQALLGKDPSQSILNVEKYIKKAKKYTSESPYLDGVISIHLLTLIEYQLDHKLDPRKLLSKTQIIIKNILTSRPDDVGFLEQKAYFLVLQERARKMEDQIYQFDFSTAIKIYKNVIKRIGTASANTDLAKVYLYSALYETEINEIKSKLKNGVKYCEDALIISPNYSFALYYKMQLINLGIEKEIYHQNRKNEAEEIYQILQDIHPLLLNKILE